jgi:PAS domain S-box-containing protein
VYKTGNPFSASEMPVTLEEDNGHFSDVYLNFVCQPYRNNEGNVDGIFFFAIDVTEQVLSRKKIEESELRYRSLVEQATDAICITDASMKFIDINPYGLDMFGYRLEEALQLSLPDILFTDDLAANPIRLNELKLGKTTRSERRLKRKDGTAVDMAVSTKLMEDGRLIMFGHDITERKKLEEAQKESEKRLRQIIDLVPHSIFAKDAKGKFVLANEAAARTYGSTVEDLIGKSDADFNSNKEEVEHFMREDLKVISSGNTKYNIEETITDAAGNIRILSTTKIPYTSPGVDLPGVLGVSVDISERKKAEAVLKENETQLSIVTQIVKLGYWELDVIKGRFTLNDQFYSVFKTTAEKVGGYTMSLERYVSLFVYPDDVPIVAKEVADAVNSTDPHFSRKIEHRIIYGNGDIGQMAVCFFIAKDDQGRTIKTFGATQDITDRKKSEAKIRSSEERYRQIVETSREGSWVVDENNRTSFVNKILCEILGYSS